MSVRDYYNKRFMELMQGARKLAEMFPPPPPPKLTRNQKIGRLIYSFREWLALKIAPWLEQEDWDE